MEPIDAAVFDALVDDALDAIPAPLAAQFDNVVLVTEDADPEDPDLLGVYEGVPLTERDEYGGVLPDRIVIYRLPLCAQAADADELLEEVRITVVHELAHHMGIDDEELHRLGWA